jgi:formate/nitrite transporter
MADAKTPSFDALLPMEMARRAEDVGVAKAAMPLQLLFALAVLAGAFISLGAVFSTIAMTGADALPFGVARVLGGLTFCLGLALVVVGGAELFTGNALLVIAWASRRVTTGAVLRNWGVVFVGNFVGALGTAALVAAADTHLLGGGAVGRTAIAIAAAKCALPPLAAFARGVLCNALVCLAVWMTLSARTTTDRLLAVLFPITAFVAAGFEHSIANMYFVPYALFLGMRDAALLTGVAHPPTWSAFLLGNLLPVTLGNVVGGGVLVAATYWFVYRAHDEAPPARP